MFENLSERLERSFKILKGEGKITEINVAETMKDVRRALLDADVNYKVAKQFTDTVKQKALGQNVLTAVKPSQLMVKIVHDELAELMGGTASELKVEGRAGAPAIILMSGLQGSGKTTFSGKLANLLKTRNRKKPLLVACDVYRPAAIEQLKVVGASVGVPVYTEPDNKNVVEIANHAIQEAKAKANDVVIIDTAGRLAVDEEMMQEIETLKKADVVTGARIRVKIVKNKVAPPYRQAEFEMVNGQGISREGSILDMAVETGIIDKSGSWFLYKTTRIGQGRENAKAYLKSNPEIAEEILAELKNRLMVQNDEAADDKKIATKPVADDSEE